MTSSRCLYSLPKTQPTLSSSLKSKYKTSNKISYQQLQTCPQVSAFNINPVSAFNTNSKSALNINQKSALNVNSRQQKYTHNMNIDYGRLSKPFKQSLKQSIKKQLNLLNYNTSILLSTKKFNNLKQYTLNLNQTDAKQATTIQPPIHLLLTQKKKALSTQRLMRDINPQSGSKHSQAKQKHQRKKNRIISVKAYELTNPSYNQQIQQIRKSRQTIQQSGQKQNQDSLRSSRKISHSRIIKTFNPTAGMQTKIITYPDLSEVIRIRQSRRK